MKKKAFTLVELLVVIAIIAILATAGIVGYTVFTEKARKSNAESELNQAKTLLEAEALSNQYFEITDVCTFGYATDASDKATWITKEAYDALVDKTGYTVLTITNICDKSDDEELQHLSSKLSYDTGKITMTSTSNSKYEAVWNLAEGTVVGKKK